VRKHCSPSGDVKGAYTSRKVASLSAEDTYSQEFDDRFVQLLSSNQLRLRSYVFTLIRDANDADDVLQNASIVLWKKRSSYDESRAFFPWAAGVVLIEILKYRRRVASDKLQFGEALINSLAEDYLEYAEENDRRREALPICIGKLDSRDRWLISARYSSEIAVAQIAKQLDTPLSTVYRSLARIREILYQCVQRTIAQEAHPAMDLK
jgi:RNA polymerase sigma-70 factor, ECF subfamily